MKEQDGPLVLTTLWECVTPETYKWLEAYERSQAAQVDEEGDEAGIANLFLSAQNDDDDEEDKEDVAAVQRVQEWSSSRVHADGIGGYEVALVSAIIEDKHGTRDKTSGDNSVRIQYILSDAAGGHGDNVWAASRHISNLLADPQQCRSQIFGEPAEIHDDEDVVGDNSRHPHPLMGRTFLELGAGAGLPSWTALACGATVVVCTDLPIAPRIRALAEAAQRNRRHDSTTQVVKVCPHTWGTPVDPLVSVLMDDNDDNRDPTTTAASADPRHLFDVIVAADCIYNPEFHSALLHSIRRLLQPKTGVALLPFCLHGNTPDENVWSIIPMAESMGFVVVDDGKQIPPQQLSPQHCMMDPKRALVYTLRLYLPSEAIS